MNSTLPRHAADIATGIGETASGTIDKGRDRAREVMVTAEERLPDSAVDWTREHVPGLTPRRRRVAKPPRLLVVVALLAAVVTMVWWFQRSTGDASQQPVRNAAPDHDGGSEPSSAVAGG